MSDPPPADSLESARAFLANLLANRAPMTDLQLKAVLRGKKMPCSDEHVSAIFETDGFFRDEAGRIGFRQMEPAPIAESDRYDTAVGLNLTQLCVLLGVGPGDVERHIRGLARSQPDVRWQRLWQELDLGKSPQISTGTLASLRGSIDRERARQFEDEARAKIQRTDRAIAPTKRLHPSRNKEDVGPEPPQAGQTDLIAKTEANRRALDDYLEKRRKRLAARSVESIHSDPKARATVDTRPTSQGMSASTRWVRSATGCLCLRVAPAETEGERRLESSLRSLTRGLVVLNATIRVGRQEREVDAIIVRPHAVITIEQKDTWHRGEIVVPINGPATVGGNPVSDNFRTQARKAAQVLASLLRKNEPRIDLGFVTPVLCFHGRDIWVTADEPTEVRIATTETISALIRDFGADPPPIKAAEVKRFLSALSLPLLHDSALRELGFG